MLSKAAFLTLALFALPIVTHCAPPSPVTVTGTAPPADLTLGDELVLRLRAPAGGLTPQQRVAVIDGRIAAILGTPNIRPADVAVFTPKGHAPVIYALGRRLITVDSATVKASGDTTSTPLVVATRWAKRFQQVMPRVCWRPSNAPETVVPANPPLTITPDFTRIGGNVGMVTLRGKTVIILHGPQHGGLTAQERADLLSARLDAQARTAQGADAVQVRTDTATPPNAFLRVAGQPFLTIDPAEAKRANVTPNALARTWAASIRAALHLPDPDTLPPAVAAPALPAPAPALPAPAPPVSLNNPPANKSYAPGATPPFAPDPVPVPTPQATPPPGAAPAPAPVGDTAPPATPSP